MICCFVLPPNLLALHQRIGDKLFALQILLVHVHCCDLMIIIRCIIVPPLLCIAAGGIKGNLILAVSYLTASSWLLHTA